MKPCMFSLSFVQASAASHTVYQLVLLESSKIFLRRVHGNDIIFVLLILNKGFLCLLNKTITVVSYSGLQVHP